MIEIFNENTMEKIPCEINSFPDGSPRIKVTVGDVAFTNTPVKIRWKYEGEVELVYLFYIASHLKQHGIKTINLYMPYISNARMDRVEDDDTVFTLKHFSNLINFINFNSVTVCDPHSNVSTALIDKVKVVTGKSRIEENLRKINNFIVHDAANKNIINPDTIDMLFFPDEGAMKRYSKGCNMSFAYGIKERNWNTGEIENYQVKGNISKGANILIVDDICSYGGTFYHAAKGLKEKYGVNKVYLFVTHCENSVLEGKLPEGNYVDRVFTTESIYNLTSDYVIVI